jgi:glycosyltransferase involved in cell wall biosynthesis
VATSAGDAPIIVGDAGLVVPVGDQAALVKACRETLEQSVADLAAQKARGRQRAVEEYSLERNARRFIDIYEEVMRA